MTTTHHQEATMIVPPTRSEKITWATFYATITLGGILVLALPPRTIGTPLGDLVTLAWGLLLTTAIIPTVSSLHGRYKWEYVTLIPVTAGILIYAGNVWWIVFTATPTRAAQASIITALAIGLFRR